MYQVTLISILVLTGLVLTWFLPAYLWHYLCKKNGVKQKFTKILWVYFLSEIVITLATFCILVIPAVLVFIFFPDVLDSFLGTLVGMVLSTIIGGYVGGFLLKKFCGIQFKLGFKIALITGIVFSIFLVGLLGLKSFAISHYKFVGPSMGVTIEQGDIVVVNKMIDAYDIKRNTVVVFQSPSDRILINRVIGLPGETIKNIEHRIKICTSDTACIAEKIPYYISEEMRDICEPLTSYPLENGYFTMGDDRNKSLDSRCCFSNNGCKNTTDYEVTPNNIVGKAWFKIWPEFKFIK